MKARRTRTRTCLLCSCAIALPLLALQVPAGAQETRPPAQPSPAAAGESDEQLASALESALARQASGVLTPGVWEIEPELSYFYDEPDTGRRRDGFGLALNARVGLHGGLQLELRLPYVLEDRWRGIGSSSGIGDVRLGLLKEVLPERDGLPALFTYAYWRTRSGDINRQPATGFGQNGLQLGVSVSHRQDPVVLVGSLSYTANFGSARLASGAAYDSGDTIGLRLASYLAATPATSLSAGISLNSSMSDRFNGGPVDRTSRVSGMLDLGSTTVIGRGRFLSVSAGIGVTPAAPKMALAVSLPFRF